MQPLIPLRDKRIIDRFRRWWAGTVLLVLVTIGGSYAAVHDMVIWRALAFENTGLLEPVFRRDIAFYLFQLPALNFLWTLIFIFLWTNLAVVALFYAYEDVWQTRGRTLTISPVATRHLATLGMALFLWKTLGYRLSAWNIITARDEPVSGLDYTALHFRLPIFLPLAVFSLIAAFGLWRASRLPNSRAIRQVLLLWGAANLILGTVTPVLVEIFYVRPNRIALETPLLEARRDATRNAFDLQNVGAINAQPALLRANSTDAESVMPLWTPEILRKYLNVSQRRGDNFTLGTPIFDRYQINGTRHTVFVAPREGVDNSIGNGLVFCDATRISPDGQPLIYDVAHFSTLRLKRPEIVFGSGEPGPLPDFSRRAPDFWQHRAYEDEFTPYNLISADKYQNGHALRSLSTRFLLAWRFFDKRILWQHDKKLVWHRQIIERCKQIAPFFVYGEPRAVLTKGRIVWLIPAHSVADSYPLSFPTGHSKINYLCTAALATVDAYDGKVQFFVLDEKDCILQAHRRLFPEIFQNFAALPDDLRVHLAPSQLQFAAQSDVWARILSSSTAKFLSGQTHKFATVRQNVPQGEDNTNSLLATPFFQNDTVGWIQLLSENSTSPDEKSMTTPICGAFICQLMGKNTKLSFWRFENPVQVPIMKKQGLASFNAALDGGQLLLHGVQFLEPEPPKSFWYSQKSGWQTDFADYLAAKWNAIGKEAGAQGEREKQKTVEPLSFPTSVVEFKDKPSKTGER